MDPRMTTEKPRSPWLDALIYLVVTLGLYLASYVVSPIMWLFEVVLTWGLFAAALLFAVFTLSEIWKGLQTRRVS